MRSTVNRVLLALAGLVLVVVGGAVLATGLGASVPGWWPWDGKGDVLLSTAARQRWRDEGWWWPTVIAILAVLVVLALWWFLAQFRRGGSRRCWWTAATARGPGCGGAPWRTRSPTSPANWTAWPAPGRC